MKILVMTKKSYNTKSWGGGDNKDDVVEMSNATREQQREAMIDNQTCGMEDKCVLEKRQGKAKVLPNTGTGGQDFDVASLWPLE